MPSITSSTSVVKRRRRLPSFAPCNERYENSLARIVLFARNEFVVRTQECLSVRRQIVEHDTRASHDSSERVRCYNDMHTYRAREVLRKTSDERRAASEEHAALHHVRNNFGGRRFEHLLYFIDKLLKGMADCVAYVLVGHDDFARESRDEVATANDNFETLSPRRNARDGNLYLLGTFFTDKHLEFVSNVRNDVGIELVAGDADIAGIHEPAATDDTDVGRATTDVDDHAAARLMYRQIDTDSRRHGLLDDMHFACPRCARSIAHGTHLDRGDARWHADAHARPEQFALARLRLPAKIREHLRSHFEVRYDTVDDGLHRLYMCGCA